MVHKNVQLNTNFQSNIFRDTSQPEFTCSKSTMETTAQCVKSVIDSVLVSLLFTLKKFHKLSWCFHR